MAKKVRPLKGADSKLLRRTESARLADLGVEELLSLHKKVRRARKKHVASLRARAGRKKEKQGAVASAASITARHRAAQFEHALAGVSAHLARSAQHSAEALETDLVGRIRDKKSWKGTSGPGRSGKDGPKSHGREKDARPSNGVRW